MTSTHTAIAIVAFIVGGTFGAFGMALCAMAGQPANLKFQELRAESLRKPPDPHPLLSQLIDDNNASEMLILARKELAQGGKPKPENC